MSHNVFLSYSSKDKPTAEAVCSALELNSIKCWIAPRDITPGISFAEAIIDAICTSKVFVLIFSSNSNISQQVSKEVERAVHHGIPIIPLRIEDTPMSKQMEYYTSNIHWLDAFTPPFESHLNKLCEVIHMIMAVDKGGVKDIDLTSFEKTHSSWTMFNKENEQLPTKDPEQLNVQLPKQVPLETDRPAVKVAESQNIRVTPKKSIRKSKLKKFVVLAIALASIVVVAFTLWVFIEIPKPVSSPIDYLKAGYESLEIMDYENAKDQFNKALLINPRDYEAQLGMATALYRQVKIDEALIALNRAIDLNNQDPFAYMMIGEIYRHKNEWDKAIQYFQKYLNMVPPGTSDYIQVSQLVESLEVRNKGPVDIPKKTIAKPKEIEIYDPTDKLRNGIDAYNQGNYDKCITHMEEILNLDSENVYAQHYLNESKKMIANFILSNFGSAKEAFEKGNYTECIEKLEKVLQVDPKNKQSLKYMNLALTNLSSQQIGMLVHQYVRSVENNRLLNFYEKNCMPKIYEETKKDVLLMLRVYHSLRVEVTDLSIRFDGLNKAEASFSSIITGIQNTEEKRNNLFKGIQKWTMIKEGEEWRIKDINYN